MLGKAENQLGFSLCFFKRKSSLLFLATLVPCLALFCFLTSLSFCSYLATIPILILSTVVFLIKFTNKKRKICLDENPINQHEEEVTEEPNMAPVVENQTKPNTFQGGEPGFEHEFTGLPSDTEYSSGTTSSEGFELDWVNPSSICHIGSISDNDDDDEDEDEDEDEDGLIEIALMGCDSNGLVEERKQNQKQYVQNLLVDSVFQENKLMELFGEEINDLNDEDNLIEIDISMGSIKRSRLEIGT